MRPMKINRVLVACCKKDFYLARICVASIRYWNKQIPVALLKDFTAGYFDTTQMEAAFDVTVAPLPFSRMKAYSKLWPFVAPVGERVLMLDADIIWLGDLIPKLEQFSEDMLVQTYRPAELMEEMHRWFYRYDAANPFFRDFTFPGFLFNSGQMVINTGIFPLAEVKQVLEWGENTRPKYPELFVCADQDVVNYLFAKRLAEQRITYRHVHLYEWGWHFDTSTYPFADIVNKKGHPILLHWYGEKKGLLFSMPNSKPLYFFEKQYYAQVSGGKRKLLQERLRRTWRHFDVLLYTCAKKLYRFFVPYRQVPSGSAKKQVTQ